MYSQDNTDLAQKINKLVIEALNQHGGKFQVLLLLKIAQFLKTLNSEINENKTEIKWMEFEFCVCPSDGFWDL